MIRARVEIENRGPAPGEAILRRGWFPPARKPGARQRQIYLRKEGIAGRGALPRSSHHRVPRESTPLCRCHDQRLRVPPLSSPLAVTKFSMEHHSSLHGQSASCCCFFLFPIPLSPRASSSPRAFPSPALFPPSPPLLLPAFSLHRTPLLPYTAAISIPANRRSSRPWAPRSSL